MRTDNIVAWVVIILVAAVLACRFFGVPRRRKPDSYRIAQMEREVGMSPSRHRGDGQ